MLIAEVLLPIAVRVPYSYRVVDDHVESTIKVGSLVTVPIGKSRVASGVVVALRDGDESDQEESLRDVISLLYDDSVATYIQIEFWNWLSRYYMLAYGSVAYNFLPSILKLSADSVSEPIDVAGIDKRDYLHLADIYHTPSKVEELLDSLQKKRRQHELIVTMVDEIYTDGDYNRRFEISSLVQSGYGRPLISALVESGVLERVVGYEQRKFQEVPYKSLCDGVKSTLLPLVDSQFENKNIVLIESQRRDDSDALVISMIDRELSKGGKVLFVTPQLNRMSGCVELLSKYFPEHIVVYEKGVNRNRQYDNYFKILSSSGAMVIVTNRMGVGLPFSDLDLVVVDREHEQIYQGFEHELEFNGRDAAIYLSHIHCAKCLLLSPSPSIESLNNVVNKKYGFVTNKESFKHKVIAIDRRNIARGDRQFYSSSSSRRFLSNLVIKEITDRTARGERVVLYQNRKGYSTTTECGDCGAIQNCDRCHSVLVYYKSSDTLKCRYCGRSFSGVSQCQECGSHNLLKHGVGSENVEMSVRELFPNHKVVRFDASTFESAKQLKSSIEQIVTGDAQIVVGTQQLCNLPKIDNITLLAVVNGDNLFSMPDYRNNERAYQLLTSLRSMLVDSRDSLMVLQMSGDDRFMRNFTDNDFAPLYHREIYDRREFLYPPFYKIITYQIEHRDEQTLINSANRFIGSLRNSSSLIVSDAIPPLVDKINNCYIRIVNIKTLKGDEFTRAKELSFERATTILKGIKWRVKVE